MKNETLLHEVIEDGLTALKGLEKGTEEYETLVNGQTKLIAQAIEIDRLNSEHELKEKQLAAEKRDKLIAHTITVASLTAGIITTCYWTAKTFVFEETGTITTTPGRHFAGKAIGYFFNNKR